MTDKTGLTDFTCDYPTRDYATGDSPQAHRVPDRRPWTTVMMHFWAALVVPPILIQRSNTAPESCARKRR